MHIYFSASTAPGDYDAVSGSLLTFSPGQPTQTVNVTTLDDDILENPREQFFVVASTNDPSVTIAPEQATIDILDNDGMYKCLINSN